MPGQRRPRAAHTAGAVALLLLGVLLLVAGVYSPRQLFDDAELALTANLVLRGLGFVALGAGAALLVAGRRRGDGGPSET